MLLLVFSASLKAARKALIFAWWGLNDAETFMVSIESGVRSNSQNTVPAIIVQNHGSPVLTLISSNVQEITPVAVHSGDPIAARSPYWRVAGALLVMFSDRMGSVAMTSFENPEAKDALGSTVVDSGMDSMTSWGGSRSIGTVLEFEPDPQFHSDKFRVAPGIRRTTTRMWEVELLGYGSRHFTINWFE